MPKFISKGNNKDGGHCDGCFGKVTGCCIYYSIIKHLFATMSIPTSAILTIFAPLTNLSMLQIHIETCRNDLISKVLHVAAMVCNLIFDVLVFRKYQI